MRNRLFVLFVLLATAIFAAPISSQGVQRDRQAERERQRERSRSEDQDHDSDVQRDLPERDEINQTVNLSRGARVEVSGINGTVEVETANVNTAEIHIVRSANDKADLEFHKIIIEQSADRLSVHGEKDDRKLNGRGHEVRQRVMMKIPRQVNLSIDGINGKAKVGAVDGPVTVRGVNGAVNVAQAQGYSDIDGINGRVYITITGLSERGIHVRGVNGAVVLQFAEDLNADLDVSAVNGGVLTDVPNVTIQGKLDRSNFRAKIGTGGSPISVSGINGTVKLARVGAAG